MTDAPALTEKTAGLALESSHTRDPLLRVLQSLFAQSSQSVRQTQGRVVALNPFAISGLNGDPMPAMAIKGLTYEVGDFVVCFASSPALPIAIPVTRTP